MLSSVTDFQKLRLMGYGDTVVLPELRTTLPAFIHSAGFHEDLGPSTDEGKNGLEVALIQHTLSGRGKVRYEDHEVVVETGQTLLLCYPHQHFQVVEEGERWEYFYIALGGHEAVRGIREIVDRAGPVLRFPEDSPALARAADACRAAVEGKLNSPYRASELAYGIVMGLLSEDIAQGERIPARQPSLSVPPFIPAVEEFCRLNFARPIGVDDMARVANMSRFHFSRVFEKARGTPPGRYLARLRLEEAMRLVSAGGTTVKEVAHRCGYGDANYFCKVFRKSFGVSPGAFRSSRAQ
jgi:AraC-like DNA-binding protein